MPNHEYFLQLGALAAIGQVSAEEDRELSEHLRACVECQDAYSDYSQILTQELPQANPVRFRMKPNFVHPSAEQEIRDRFFARARAAGVQLSPAMEMEKAKPHESTTWPWLLLRPQALYVLALVVVITGWWMGRTYKVVSRGSVEGRIHELGTQNESLHSEVTRLNQEVREVRAARVPPGDQPGDQQRASTTAEQLRTLEQKLNDARSRANQLARELEGLRKENDALSGSRQQDANVIADLRSELDRLQATEASNIASLVEARDRVRLITAELDQEKEKLGIERQLVSVSSDVRQLMGARNLHIMDVHDVNGAGKSAKSFGRVFYSEGQSLVFYAFDLPNRKLTPAKYYFQAWAEREGQSRSLRNLGTFAIDDHEQHRWVLKVNDPALLKGIDSVFVTAETAVDPPAPHGQRLLYAYFDVQPNHP